MKVLSVTSVNVVVGSLAMVLLTGCATKPEQPIRTVPPLFSTMPAIELPPTPQLLKIPTPPAQKPIPISIVIPKKTTTASAESAIMRHGAVIKAGASVVICLPSVVQRMLDDSARSKETCSVGGAGVSGFKTDGYFNTLEQFAEKELLATGLFVKDRNKFEAKLRDLHDGIISANTQAGSANTQAVGKLSPFKTDGELKRQEIYDLPELIRAAQDGEVLADYILQVSDLSIRHYTGEPLMLGARPEVQAALSDNPGLRVGVAGDNGDAIPATLAQPWMLTHFNAKLINVKTGTIDWIGDYSVESLAVLDEGMRIDIGGRRLTANAKTIVDAINGYNERVCEHYKKVQSAKTDLEYVYREVMQPVTYQGNEWQGNNIQFQRKTKATAEEQTYAKVAKAYKITSDNLPPELKMDWTYYYVLDQPTVTPDLANPKNENDAQRLLKHVRALGSKTTHDLLGTIKVTQ